MVYTAVYEGSRSMNIEHITELRSLLNILACAQMSALTFASNSFSIYNSLHIRHYHQPPHAACNSALSLTLCIRSSLLLSVCVMALRQVPSMQTLQDTTSSRLLHRHFNPRGAAQQRMAAMRTLVIACLPLPNRGSSQSASMTASRSRRHNVPPAERSRASHPTVAREPSTPRRVHNAHRNRTTRATRRLLDQAS